MVMVRTAGVVFHRCLCLFIITSAVVDCGKSVSRHLICSLYHHFLVVVVILYVCAITPVEK